ncbi:hypothetical protein CCR94_07655 [Rhodoblastus sphagnicola]|uniref:DUF3597 domain-containing protein n=1 Tax=Rhodoblastus sphagnicola TaxID=333368 RepID=A0A2S6NBF8_9HYPH|nr:DUF3597 domain-containing protein [Rhodoblastus sphagnicola]PPQ31962.1 hypothetical protein CCR94_07655 [Rhodoblastus sphagnicola]
MSIFGSIIGKIFGSNPAKAAPAEPAADEPAAVPAAPEVVPAAVHVDVAKILDGLNEANPETLDWRVSIVDLLKVLGLDSSPAARKQLATELKFEGDAEDSTALNIWLHKKVIDLIAANGGEIPAELLKK